MKSCRILSILLYLIAIHSVVVGIVLVFISFQALEIFGYIDYHGTFFRVQGGVFHIVMALIYSLAAWDVFKFRILVTFTVIAKFTATLFLFSYYFFVDRIWMVAVSGAGDLIMGILVLYLLLRLPISESDRGLI
jgi:hypothetical protein